MRYFPLFLDLRHRSVIVVGGGMVAERKVALLLPAGAQITIVAPDLCAPLTARLAAGEVTHLRTDYVTGMLARPRLVIAATDDRATNLRVAADAEAAGILVNVVDDLEPSTCIVPAIVDRSPLVVAISSAGSAPMLARDVRARIELLIDESFGHLAAFLESARARIKAALPDIRARRGFYERLLRGPVPHLVRHRRLDEASTTLERTLHAPVSNSGRVVLVGAGPGDPGLLTINAVRSLQAADVVLYDRLVAKDILAYARREALLIEVGKSANGSSTAQQDINALLATHARTGATVVRLKGGDPFVFGRGGEELEYLRAHDVRFEVVPGVTAATACAAYAGIPLTHREHAASARFITGHRREAREPVGGGCVHDEAETLVVYMGVGMLAELQGRLLGEGRDPATPIAFIENGTRPDQRVIVGRLADAQALANDHRLRAPALIIVGAVAALAESLHWFGQAPTTRLAPSDADPGQAVSRERRRVA